jgi:hypothetical protein
MTHRVDCQVGAAAAVVAAAAALCWKFIVRNVVLTANFWSTRRVTCSLKLHMSASR